MKVYEGIANAIGPGLVFVGDKPLNPCHHVYNHSPDGFSWGFHGSGPSQLALAICMDALGGDKKRAMHVYQDVKVMLIAPLDQHKGFRLPEEEVLKAIRQIEAQR